MIDWNKIYLILLNLTKNEVQAMEALIYLMKQEDLL